MHLKFPTRSLSGLDLAITVSEIIWVKRVKGANPKIIAFLIIILSPMYELFHWTQFLSGLYQQFCCSTYRCMDACMKWPKANLNFYIKVLF